VHEIPRGAAHARGCRAWAFFGLNGSGKTYLVSSMKNSTAGLGAADGRDSRSSTDSYVERGTDWGCEAQFLRDMTHNLRGSMA
jgi:hypothetical protein